MLFGWKTLEMDSKFTKLLIYSQLLLTLIVLSECGLEEMYRWRQISFDQLQDGKNNYDYDVVVMKNNWNELEKNERAS